MIKGLDYLMISLSSGCISNCSGCNKFLENNLLFDMKNILNNINRLKNIGFVTKSFMFFNYDYFKLDKQELNVLYNSVSSYNKTVVFHTDFSLFNEHGLSFVKDNKIKLIFQKNLDIKSIKTFLLSINKVINLNVEYIFWVNSNNLNLLDIFKKRLISLGILEITKDYFKLKGTIIKFFIYSGERKGIEKCFLDNGIKINNKSIFVDNNIYRPNYFEVMLNGDIRVHEPPCGYGNLIISNIYRTKLQILEDFKVFLLYINNFIKERKLLNQEFICNECNKNEYDYKRYL